MAGIVLFQVNKPDSGTPTGIFVEFQNIPTIINFSTSGFIKDSQVVTCTSEISLILSTQDIQKLSIEKILHSPETSAAFYFNYSGSWLPLVLSKVIPANNIEEISLKPYVILYFTSKFYQLPSELKEFAVISSPLGIASTELFLNHKQPLIRIASITPGCDLIEFSYFPGAEGSYCAGKMLIPSKTQGLSLAYSLPKL